MPTASVHALKISGRQWFRKVNPDSQLNDIEFRIYRALRRSFDYTPRVIRESSTTLLVEGAGTTFSDVMNSPAHERLASLDILYKTIKARCDVNSVVNSVLTDADKAHLTQMQREKLLASAQKRNPYVNGDEIVNHYWAYRMMNALGIHDEKFKELYTECIGARIEALLSKFGRWCSDNHTRNNVVTADGTVIPFDFNSIRYGLSQMDTATIAAHYIMGGPLAIAAEGEEQESAIKRVAELEGFADDPDYLKAFLLSSVHANGIIAGYRTQECRERSQAILDEYLAFARAFDDIDYYQSAASFSISNGFRVLAQDQAEAEKLNEIERTITHHTFGERMFIQWSIPTDVQQFGES